MRRFSIVCLVFSIFLMVTLVGQVPAEASHTAKNNAPIAHQPAALQAADWAATFSPRGLSSYVSAMAVSGNSIYVGGGFIAAGNVEAHYIASYNTSTQAWSALGSGAPGGVNAILIDGNDIYVGGEYFLSRWNTVSQAWTELGSFNTGTVHALAKIGTNLYAGGAFDYVSGQTISNIARLDLNTGTWYPLGSGTNAAVFALTVNSTTLYAGGAFTQAGGNAASTVARWSTNTWSALGSGPDTGTTFALAMNAAELIAGGNYTGNANGTSVFRWDGAWHAMGNGLQYGYEIATALNVNSHGIYAAGKDCQIMRWNGTNTWVQVGADLSRLSYSSWLDPSYNYVNALAYSNNILYAGGTFTAAGTVTAIRAAGLNLNDSTWSALFNSSGPGGNGLDGEVNAILVNGTDIYVGGSFNRAGPIAANYIAKWNGSSWSSLGIGVNYHVLALALQGNTLYVGGRFTRAGGNDANYIAKWDTIGNTWSTLKSGEMEGVNQHVEALALSGNKLYVGGWFTRVGIPIPPATVYGPPTDYFAIWNTGSSTWTPVISDLNRDVTAIVVHGTDVYVGGTFYQAGSANLDGLARWDSVGNQWYKISGVAANVHALAASGDELFVGGSFSPRIRRLDMTNDTWLPMTGSVYGGGYGGIVYTIAAHPDGSIYVGGDFTNAGGKTAYGLARWLPGCDMWLPVGSQGLNARILALAVTNAQVFAGGQFSLAYGSSGNVPSARFANIAHRSITCQRIFLPAISR